MRRRHSMPFGAEPLAGGGTRFRLWAPAAERVELLLEGGQELSLPMASLAEGWFGVETPEAHAGTRYRYLIDQGTAVPDPASRFQPLDVDGPSEVIDPGEFEWRDEEWCGRRWEEVVLYELHVGTFTRAGTFGGVARHLDHLVDLGVTALELMPVADFPGRWSWGYDGVLLFAPDSRYGRPEDLKRLIQAAHERELMVLLDVVYNHFGPEGNYLHRYAPQFFNQRHHTPWGAALDFERPWVRQFFVHNALYWLEEFHLDGLRLDAVHAIHDDSSPDILEEIAVAVTQGPGRSREVHLVLENDDNAARYLRRDRDGQPRWYVAQWNDDLHHALHVLATGETEGYYRDYADDPISHLGRCLIEGFAYQGEPSAHRENARRGEPTGELPPGAFVGFLQNHDQVGNRAFGERLHDLVAPATLRALTAVLLLAPSPPLLFMGQEWCAPSPFLFFCDLGAELAAAVTEGRRREFARFSAFRDPARRACIPDPLAPETYERSLLSWESLALPAAREWLSLHRQLLRLRAREIVPRLGRMTRAGSACRPLGARALMAEWQTVQGERLSLLANLGDAEITGIERPPGKILHALPDDLDLELSRGRLAGWSVGWLVDQASPG